MDAPCKSEGRLQCRVEEKVLGATGMTGPDLNARIETYYVRVRGMVQGVGFRHATVRRAHELGVTGWVANLPDGSVEAMLQGPANQIDRMLEWMRRGPPSARVTDFASEERAIERRFPRFEQH
jgi:acylphosphatase